MCNPNTRTHTHTILSETLFWPVILKYDMELSLPVYLQRKLFATCVEWGMTLIEEETMSGDMASLQLNYLVSR